MTIELKSARATVAALGLVTLLGAIPANAAAVFIEEPPAPLGPL